MAKKPPATVAKQVTKAAEAATKYRTYPIHTIVEALVVAEKILTERGGKPFNRLLLAQAVGYTPSSSNYRDLLSSSYKYGLTDGTEKAAEIALTEIGKAAAQHDDQRKRMAAIRQAVLKPPLFRKFFEDYRNQKLPSAAMMPRILTAEYHVPAATAEDCTRIIVENGRYAEIIRDISNAPYCMFDDVVQPEAGGEQSEDGVEQTKAGNGSGVLSPSIPRAAQAVTPTVPADKTTPPEPPRAIFIGHGRKRGPLEKLIKILTAFQIPHKVVVDEANLGRPIPVKVRETMLQCGSAILIFTCDQQFKSENGEDVWRPSENVVHELGACSFAYEDRVVIFKEKGIHFPTNFQSIGYIEFEENAIEAKTADLLKELIGFGLVRIIPTP